MNEIEKIYKSYANLIKNYVFVIVKDMNLAEEIMQETFVVAITQINKFRGDCEIFVWLCSIAKKILYKQTKKHGLNNILSIDEIEISDGKNMEEEILENDSIYRFYKSLQKLDYNTREVMNLRLTSDLTFKEIGQILHKSENWARVTFFRGKQKLSKEDII